MARTPKLTPETQLIITEAIRRGAFDWVAAQAAGVDANTFREWLRRGQGRDPDRPQTPVYATFATEVARARATARQSAETRVFQDNPFNWLRYGPGRERTGEPGWTEASNVDLTSAGQSIQLVPWAPKPLGDADEDPTN
jgi:hypothetical protein